MPYGFTRERLNKGIKPSTVKFQVIVVEQFFSYLRRKYKRDITPNEITTKDVRDFLDYQKNIEKFKDGTIYRKQSNLKVFFNYLWEQKEISHDIMEKFEYFNEPITKIKGKDIRLIEYDYEFLLQQEKRVFNSKLTDTCKFLMLLYIKGIEVSDMYELQIPHVEIKKDKAIIRYVSKRTGKEVILEYKDEQEIAVIEAMLYKAAIEKNTEYLISVKTKENKYVQSKPILTRFYMVEINKFIGINLRADDIRITYADYLYTKEKKSVGEIAEILGRNKKYVASLLDTALERMVNKKYNHQKQGQSENSYAALM